MEARMKTIAAGPDINVSPGQLVTGDRAAEFAAAGYADKVAAEPPAPRLETAAVAPPEVAMKSAAEPRRPARRR